MAKNNFLLYATRGAVGNIVVRRDGGQTIVSSRPTSVANPRTYAQAEVRMRLTAASRFFSPLSGVLAQAWQGKSTRDSQAAFTSAAIELMKAKGYGWPKGEDFGPLPFQVSKGSVASTGALINGGGVISLFPGYIISADGSSLGWLSSEIRRAAGLEVDKFQLTLIAVERREDPATSIETYHPRYARIMCDVSSTATLASVLPSWITSAGTSVAGDEDISIGTSTLDLVGFAAIISYYDRAKKVWVRSTEYLYSDPEWLAAITMPGAYESYVESFMDSADTSDPDGRVYLDGSTTRSSSGGGSSDGGYDYDLSTFVPNLNGTVLSVRPASVTSMSFDGHTVIAVKMTDGSVYPLTGSQTMPRLFGKVVSVDGTQYTLSDESLRSQCVSFASSDSTAQIATNAYGWVVEQSGIPAASIFA